MQKTKQKTHSFMDLIAHLISNKNKIDLINFRFL